MFDNLTGCGDQEAWRLLQIIWYGRRIGVLLAGRAAEGLALVLSP